MSLSPYFQDLNDRYQAELDDLREDTEGRDVLQARLRDKRKPAGFKALLQMIGLAPEMVAPVFHRAFTFPAGYQPVLGDLLSAEPDEFPDWLQVAAEVDIAAWALPFIDATLAQEGGAVFLSTVVGLEYLNVYPGAQRGTGRRADDSKAREGAGGADGEGAPGEGAARDRGDEDEDPDYDGDLAQGENFLEDQGFDRRSEE